MNIVDKHGNAIELRAPRKKDKAVQVMIEKMQEIKSIWRKEINDWQYGRDAFYSPHNPTTFYLQTVYQDVMLDDQLETVTGQRKLRILNQKFIIKSKDDKDEDKTLAITQNEWFYDVLASVMDSIWYGYNLIYLKPMASGFEAVEVPRTFVSPHNRLLLESELDPSKGVPIEKFKNELLYTQLYGMVGILEKAAPLTILKRHSWGAWDEFEQIFGIPIRVAKYKSGSEKAKREIANWLSEMGTAAYGVFPEEASIDILENNKTDAYQVFLEKIKRVDEGLSKMLLHQTMTTDNGSSKSQSEVHERTLSQVTEADERGVILWLNNVLKPVLIHHGMLQEQDYFGIEKLKDPAKQIEIDSKLMAGGLRLKKEYIEGLYGVELEEGEDPNHDPSKKKVNSDPNED